MMPPAAAPAADALKQAWETFGAGDHFTARALAQQVLQTTGSPEAAAALGYFLLDAGEHQAAAGVLASGLAQAPQHPTLLWYLGLLCRTRGHLQEASHCLEKACTLNPHLHEAAATLAWTLNDQGHPELALPWAQHALAAARLPERLLLVGWLLQATGQLHAAVALYREAIDALPSGTGPQPLQSLHLHLAQSLAALERNDEAEQALVHGLQRLPHNAELHRALIEHQVKHGLPAQAVEQARCYTRACPGDTEAWYLLGCLLHDDGDQQAADECFAEVQQRDLKHTDALLRRAGIQSSRGNHEAAHWLVQQVLQHQPDHDLAQHFMAQVLLDLKRPDDARRRLLPRLRRKRGSEDWRLLGSALLQKNRPAAARRALMRALNINRDNTEAVRTLGWLALQTGQLQEAREAVAWLRQRHPDDVAALIQAAYVLGASNDMEQAVYLAQRAVALAPRNADAWRALADVRNRQQRWTEAEGAIEMALSLQPDRVDSLRQLGWILLGDQRFGQARIAFQRVWEQEPEHPLSWLELGEAQCRGGTFDQGMATVEGLLQRWPDQPEGLLLKARLLTEQTRATFQSESGASEALALCRQLLRANQHLGEVGRLLVRLHGLGVPGARILFGNLPAALRQRLWRESMQEAAARHGHEAFQRLSQQASQDFPLDIWLAAAAWYAASQSGVSTAGSLALHSRQFARLLKLHSGLNPSPALPPVPRKGARLRLAYVVTQLHLSLLRRVLASHNPERTEVFVFSSRPMPPLPAHVHVEPLNFDTLPAQCVAHRIDAVIDTGGLHPLEGQMEMLVLHARRLAPLHIGWLGCWGSAGGLFDVQLTDEAAVPPGHEEQYEEALWRLEGGQWCWDPPPHAPPPGALPAGLHGPITFGVVARGLRLNTESLNAWAAVLLALPLARLHFIGHVANDWPQRHAITQALADHGVSADRLAFDPARCYEGLLAWFQGIDLLLDSLPGNGGLSLLDALWMGVPVVTQSGHWAGARQARSLLQSAGFRDWAADDTQGFVDRAVALASDRAALATHRRQLRQRLQDSPLLDGHRVAAQIEARCEAHFDQLLPGEASVDAKERVRAQARQALQGWLARDAVLQLPEPPTVARPDLSVIVVLFNQAGLTRRALQALADQRGVRFETLLVDNASTDETSALLYAVRGARFIRNTENLGFLRAVNQAAARARGRHIVLLNSDAVLHDGALAAACLRLDAEPDVGALGGRVVLSAGGLQEAGNRLFRDGSALGIGRGEDPFCPAALASRSTDYVSGVFLAVPQRVWRLLGGFDEAFAPAYYEDTDFCVRVWKAGFRVVYEPRVLLEHLEWGSAPGTLATDLMRKNRAVFLRRHHDWLQHRMRAAPARLDGDRWHSPEDQPRRPRVLFIDNEVPHMVKGGGLPRARAMLAALRDWPVTFYPLWESHDDWRAVYASLPHSTEVMLEAGGLDGLEAFLERRKGIYDVLVVSRPPNLKALQPLRQRRPELFAGLRLVYDAEALFALREIAEAAVKGQPLDRPAAIQKLGHELALARSAESVLVVSDRDAALFRAAGHQVHLLSHSIVVRRNAPGLAARSGLLFVGALHPNTPNEDGLVWFIEQVMPLLRERLQHPPTLSVVGVNRSARIEALAGPDVCVLGAQSDLVPQYDRARVFVAPVRYAGGIPVKVVEAVAHGLPAMASAVLVRQLDWSDGQDILGARDAEAFARGIALLLQDDAHWQRQQASGWDRCQQRYDPRRFEQTLRQALDPLNPQAE